MSIVKLAIASVFTSLILMTPTAQAYQNPQLGRFMQRDPAGYVDGMSLFEYVRSRPISNRDPYGLTCCGYDVTRQLENIRDTLHMYFSSLPSDSRASLCESLAADPFGPHINGWDVMELAHNKWALSGSGCGTGACAATVTVAGNCYPSEEVNYWLYGVAVRNCFNERQRFPATIFDAEDSPFDAGIRGPHLRFGTAGEIEGYKGSSVISSMNSDILAYRTLLWRGTGIRGRQAWAKAGFNGDLTSPAPTAWKNCSACPTSLPFPLRPEWGAHVRIGGIPTKPDGGWEPTEPYTRPRERSERD